MALLALTERPYFDGRVASMPEWLHPPAVADAVRTAAYLEEIEARLDAWRRSDQLAMAVAAERAEAALRAERDARTEAAMADDEDTFRDWPA